MLFALDRSDEEYVWLYRKFCRRSCVVIGLKTYFSHSLRCSTNYNNTNYTVRLFFFPL